VSEIEQETCATIVSRQQRVEDGDLSLPCPFLASSHSQVEEWPSTASPER
jgi:hypothetical protein